MKNITERSTFFPIDPDTELVGITLRQYFAGQALTGLCANQAIHLNATQTAATAIQIADYMIQLLNQRQVKETL